MSFISSSVPRWIAACFCMLFFASAGFAEWPEPPANRYLSGKLLQTFAAFDQDISLNGVYEDTEKNNVSSTGFAAAIGGRLGGNFRMEGEFWYHGKIKINDPDGLSHFDMRVFSVAANVLYDFPISNAFGAYAGAGLGLASVSTRITGAGIVNGEAESSMTPVASGMIGLTTRIASATHLDLGYKFAIHGGTKHWFYTGGDEFVVSTDLVALNSVFMGLRVWF